MHVGGGAASAQPEVDDFDGLFAVIVRGEGGKESGFFLAPFMIARARLSQTRSEVGTFRATLSSSLSS